MLRIVTAEAMTLFGLEVPNLFWCAGLLSDARVSIAQLANSTQATISVTVESQACELNMDDLRYTMGPVEKCRGGTCVDKHNVHDVVLFFSVPLDVPCWK